MLKLSIHSKLHVISNSLNFISGAVDSLFHFINAIIFLFNLPMHFSMGVIKVPSLSFCFDFTSK